MCDKWKKKIKSIRAGIQYGDYYEPSKHVITELLLHFKNNNQKVAIWGGGLKGTSFLSCVDPNNELVECIVDMNTTLHGSVVNTGQSVVSYESILLNCIDVVLVMNKVFYVEVFLLLKQKGYTGLILDVDEIVEKKMSLQQIITMKHEPILHTDDSICGYKMREIQQVACEILEEVDRICKKNKITYFLEAGSALGVERYKGFIPCDDDIDVGMFREDYEKFKGIAREQLNSGFLMQDMQPCSDYPYPYMQVVKDHTCFVRKEFQNAKMHQGIHIDIAPFDNVPNEKELRQKQINKIKKYSLLIKKKLIPELYKSKNPIKSFLVNTPYFTLKLVPLRLLRWIQYKEFIKYRHEDCIYVGDLCTHYKKDLFFEKNIFFPTKAGEFEGKSYPIPAKNEKYLSIMYGNYKMISPREDSSTKYRIIDVSTSKNYLE